MKCQREKTEFPVKRNKINETEKMQCSDIFIINITIVFIAMLV